MKRMIYNGKEYKQKEVHALGSWNNVCEGCAFVNDQTACFRSYNKDDLETHCCIEGKNYIFVEVNND